LKPIATIAILCTALQVPAASLPIPIARIMRVAHQYDASISCDTHIDRRNIVTLGSDAEGEVVDIAVLVFHDRECMGGSGTEGADLIKLTYYPNRADGRIFVNARASFPNAIEDGLPRFIDRIFVRNGKLTYTGWAHKGSEPPNFPSQRVSSELELVSQDVSPSVGQSHTIWTWVSKTKYDAY